MSLFHECKQHLPTKPHTHTHMPSSGQSPLRSIINAIIHMRHTTYRLQNTHAIETGPHTHTHAIVRSIFSQIDLQRNHSHAPHDLHTAQYTRDRNKAIHTHMPPSGQSSLRSIFNAIIHMRHTTYYLQNTHAIDTKQQTHTHATVRSIFS